MIQRLRIISVSIFSLLAIASIYFLFQLKFSFDFEDFFPKGDPDLEFFNEFREKFEADDNFLLVGVRRSEGVFNQDFLERFDSMSLAIKTVPHVNQVQSITTFSYPIISPIFTTTVPAIHIDNPDKYEADKERVLNDPRLVGNLISEDGTTLVAYIKTVDKIKQSEAEDLINGLKPLVESFGFEAVHYLGRANFQKELVAMQKREIIVSTIISNALVVLILFLIFRTFWGTFLSISSVGLALLLFFGLLGATGRELNAMSALYPVLMVIVGTSDVIHILSKYIDELKKGFEKDRAILTAIKEIGLATLLTSLTTAIGFASLLSSKIQPIKDFGINAAVGVMIAYVTVLFFTTSVVSLFSTNQIIKLTAGPSFWDRFMEWFDQFTKSKPRQIALGATIILLLCLFGISIITTNYRIESNLPKGGKITEDFRFFEKQFNGFRPFEIAVTAKGDYMANDYEVVQEIHKLEKHLVQYEAIKGMNSITTVYKSINQATKANRATAYKMPENEAKFNQFKARFVSKLSEQNMNILVSKDGKNTRISGRVLDIGADNIREIADGIDDFINTQIDTSIVEMRQTGTGIIVDKNAEYIRNSLLWGLGLAIMIVSVLMVLLFQNLRMLIISIVPNIFPLLIAGGILGFFGIELDAGIAIVFAIIFGIAVDDTIHFLSKYKLARTKGLNMDEAITMTFKETGKAICLTTVILFFAFLVLLFSVHPPSIIVGTLISVTLLSALFSDLFLIPVLIRWLGKK